MVRRQEKRLLIVEDEQILAVDLEAKLRKLGYETEGVARTGEEAVQLAQERVPDLVLMDVRLSGTMDGLEAARQIRETTGIPIVYLTAFADIFVQNPSIMQHPGMCVAKPFHIRDLKDVIEIALRTAKGRGAGDYALAETERGRDAVT
jgi:two-component system, response regulator PdtaR